MPLPFCQRLRIPGCCSSSIIRRGEGRRYGSSWKNCFPRSSVLADMPSPPLSPPARWRSQRNVPLLPTIVALPPLLFSHSLRIVPPLPPYRSPCFAVRNDASAVFQEGQSCNILSATDPPALMLLPPAVASAGNESSMNRRKKALLDTNMFWKDVVTFIFPKKS